MDNVITKVEINLGKDDHYRVHVTKRFSEEYGGGESTITLGNAWKNIHPAMDAAKGAVTVSRSHRAAFEAEDRTRIGNTPTCDECGEQHSQDTSCEEYAEAQGWNRVTTEGEMIRESAKRVGFTG